MSMPTIISGTGTIIQAINDIIESVALEEAGISQILNAEGQKIQAFVALYGVKPNELLAANKSINATINALTHLQSVLNSILSYC